MRRLALVAGAAAYAALVVIVRGEPTVGHDSGIFLSVAGRLLEGDQLYVDIVDNKDPLFYYTYAAALAVGDWKAPFVLDVAWLAVGAVSAALLCRAVGATRLTAAVAFFAYPALLTWNWYFAGFSMLAALALAPLIGWLWVRRRFVLAGALVGVGVLFKFSLGLLLVSAPIALLLMKVPSGPYRTQLARGVVGLASVLLLAAAFMAVRGELSGYLDVLDDNRGYSRDVLAERDRATGILGHLEVVTEARDEEPWEGIRLLEVTLLAGVLLALGRLWRSRSGSRSTSERSTSERSIDILAATYVATVLATVVTAGLTAVWFHHAQMLAYSALLLIALFVMLIQESSGRLWRVLAACAAVPMAVGLVGDAANRAYFEPSDAWGETGHSETAEVLETAADESATELDEVTFAHLGQNDERAVGAFLDGRFALACPDIAQYWFHPDASVLECIREETPNLVLVTPSFRPMEKAEEEWNRLVTEGLRLLRTDYELAARRETSDGSIDVWATRASVAGAGQ